METSKRPSASHTRSGNRSNHPHLVPVGGAAALPVERPPVAPPVVEGALPAPSTRAIVLRQHVESATTAAAELAAFVGWSERLGALVPSASTLGNALAFASAWTDQRTAAERWLAHVRENEILAWNHALELVDVVKTPLFFACERDATVADALPALLRVVGARAAQSRKASLRAAAARRRAAKPATPGRSGAAVEEKKAPVD